MLYSLDEVGGLVEDLGPQRDFELGSGLPWRSTVAELEAVHGVESWRGFEDVVPLRGIRALGFEDLACFRHRVFPPRRLYPAYDFQAEVNCFGEHRANHTWSLEHLTSRFGRSPRIGDVSNCLQGFWDFGLIEVSVMTFLPEKRLQPNSLYDRHPDLWQVANLTVESRLCAYRDPVHLDVSDGLNLQGIGIGRGDFLTNRLLASRPVQSGLRVWRDRVGCRIGVANPWGSIVRPWLATSQLVLSVRTPARGGGSASLEWDGVELLGSSAWDGLREAAGLLSNFLRVPLEIRNEPDE